MLSLHPADLLVVGAGPVGLLAAHAALGRGLRTRIVDQGVRTALHAYCALLHPQTVRLLESFGFGADLDRRGRAIRDLRVRISGGEPRELSLDRLAEHGMRMVVLPQSDLEEILERSLRSHSTSVLWNHEVTDLRTETDHVVARVREHGEVPRGYPILSVERLVVREHSMPARWVLGADGCHSAVRRFARLHDERAVPGRRFLFFEAEFDRELPPVIDISVGRLGTSCLWPMKGKLGRWTFESGGGLDSDVPERILATLLAERAPWFDARLVHVQWSGSGLFEVRVPNAMWNGRMALAGDSAHLGDPVGAQSMNAGLQEAADVAERIASIVQGDSTEEAMRQYSAQGVRRWRDAVRARDSWPEDGPDWAKEFGEAVTAALPALGKVRADLLEQLGIGAAAMR